jgi:hypothetical protein
VIGLQFMNLFLRLSCAMRSFKNMKLKVLHPVIGNLCIISVRTGWRKTIRPGYLYYMERT